VQNLTIQELAIVVAVQKIDPTLLTPDFLTMTQIVPTDWEILGQPVRSYEGSQITYQQGVSVVAQAQRVSFVELILNKEAAQVEVPKLAQVFVKVLSNLDFVGVGINLRGYLDFEGKAEAAQRFMFSHLLALGEWLTIGEAPVQAGINLGYTFPGKRLNLTINEASVQQPDRDPNPIVLFSGNFDYDLPQDNPAASVARLQEVLANWQQDLALYQDVIGKFKKAETAIEMPTYSS
jgi:hypothetical protein